ncbi:MAG: twin arginine-targeting protein translocase TatC [Chloroflexi bacterium RBG_19FT_COMBO_48_23]|nr:MAG: twin arginine-targeting protein translocase TatC [Chloroflexi bacterium RBG_19FT_COMBO_48_23]
MSSETKHTFRGHLRELRSCLLRSVIAILIALPISFFLANKVFYILMQPVTGLELIYTEVTEMLGTYIKVSLYSALVLTLPFIVYQAVMFVRPALTRKEKTYLYIMLPSVFLLFTVGAVFAYFVLLPPALKFLLTFGSDIATPMIRVENYISVLTKLIFWIGICFEIPLVMFFLTKIGVLKPEWLSKYRRIAYVLAFVLGAIITPTFDPLNQSLVAVPIIFLYEFGILLSKLARRKKTDIASSAG